MKKRIFSIFLTLIMVLTTSINVLPVRSYAISDQTIKAAAKAVIMKGVSTIPGGSTVAPLLGPVLGNILGIKSDTAQILEQLDLINEKLDEIMDALEELNEKLDAVQNELKEIQQGINNLSNQLDKSTRTILSEVFESKFGMTLDSYNSKLTSVAYITERMYNDMAILYESDLESLESDPEYCTSELYKTLKVAELIDTFNSNATDDYVNMVLTLSKYLDGSQIALGNPRGLFETVFLASCNNSVLGGEAAMRIANYLNQVSGTLSSAYKMLAIVAECKVYIADNYSAVKAAAAEDSETYDEDVASLVEFGLKSNYKDKGNQKIWKNLISGSSSFPTLHNKYFGEADSIAAEYNDMVESRWFDYIRSCTFTNNDIQVDFFPLESRMAVYRPCSVITSGTEGAEYANNAINAYMESSLSADEIKNLTEHVLSNQNQLFVDLSGGNTKTTTEKTLLELLSYYGFQFTAPSFAELKLPHIIAYSSSAAVTKGKKADLRVSGYDMSVNNGYYLSNGALYTGIQKYEDSQYYYFDSENDSKNKADGSILYFFAPAALEINNETDFESFILSVAKGASYYETTINLNCDVDLSKSSYKALWAGLKEADYNKGFRGTFNGNNHTIKGLNDPGDSFGAGLFRSLGSGAAIRNLTIENSTVNAPDCAYAGTVAGRVLKDTTSDQVSFTNVCVKSGSVNGKECTGGFVGYAEGYIKFSDCVNRANVTGVNNSNKMSCYVGGMAGRSQNGCAFSNCENVGEISSGYNAGGFLGYINAGKTEILKSKNAGNITGDCTHGGGFVGWTNFSVAVSIKDCENSGVISSKHAGGMIGLNYSASTTVTENKNFGNINSKGGYGGGIVGDNQSGDCNLSSNINTGDISGGSSAGILGHCTNGIMILDNCVNEGKITSPNGSAGGIVSYLYNNSSKRVINHSLKNCVNRGNVKGYYYAGGIVGNTQYAKSVDLSDSENYGVVICPKDRDQMIAGKDCTVKLDNCVYGGSTAVASIFSGGSLILIIIFAAVVLIAAAVLIIIKKKKSTASDNKKPVC